MKEFTVSYISGLTKRINETSCKLYETMGWGRSPRISEADVRLVLEVEHNTALEPTSEGRVKTK